jgi:hypothetical protein
MRTALAKFDIAVCLAKPHPTRKSEPLSEYNILVLYSKIALLTLAYEISIEEFSVQFNWKDCCTEAVNRMKACGHHTVTPGTVMTWNQRFRVTETFPHPHENEKRSKPFVFRSYRSAETIARAAMWRLKKVRVRVRLVRLPLHSLEASSLTLSLKKSTKKSGRSWRKKTKHLPDKISCSRTI